MHNTFTKAERLTGKTTVEQVVRTGTAFRQFPFRVVWRKVAEEQAMPVRIAFAVPKRSFKRAVDRNRIRRQMREAFRCNKHALYAHLITAGVNLQVLVIYTHREQLTTAEIEGKIILTLRRLMNTTDDGIR